jgi:uroporphyrinogen III methyltransferase/synthase
VTARDRGWVAIVGAGPGDPGLLTQRALELLRTAEVVLCDRLVSAGVRALIPRSARIVEVGKARGSGAAQRDIERLLVSAARAGHRVVRLKGGDPFVFGRGSEEAAALAAAGIALEVVPGVSAAFAGPASAGIPVTHRGVAASVCVLTAEEARGPRTDWRAAAAADTVVILMGLDALDTAVRALVAAGKASSTPVAVVQDATLPTQQVVTGTLATIARIAAEAHIRPPATVIVGPTVDLAVAGSRVAAGALDGRRILVTRAAHQADALADRLRALGAEPIVAPAIRIAAAPAAPMRRALDHVVHDEIDWIGFTSANGVTTVLDAIEARGLDARTLAGTSIAAIGRATADALRARGLVADLVADPATSAGLAAAFPRGTGTVLLPRADRADAALAAALARKGWHPIEVVAYRIVDAPRWPRATVAAIRAGVDIVVFASAETAHATARQLARAGIEPGSIPAVCIGPVCARGARAAGFKVRGTASEASLDALVDAAVRALR